MPCLDSSKFLLQCAIGTRQQSIHPGAYGDTHVCVWAYATAPVPGSGSWRPRYRIYLRLVRHVQSSFSWMMYVLGLWGPFEQHIDKVCSVLERFQTANLTISAEKSVFGRSYALYLGSIVSASGIQPDPEKLDKVR